MLELNHIYVSFAKKSKLFRKEKNALVIRDFSLQIQDEEIVAIVGESGCGKTTIGKVITGLLKPSSGEVLYNNQPIKGNVANFNAYRKAVQFIQQDSYAALNPVKTVYQSLLAAIQTHDPSLSIIECNRKIEAVLTEVGLIPVDAFLFKYPHQLSGGQRQRVLMARALLMEAKLIVADEPVSMIDVSLRVSILNLMSRLNKEHHISFVYITHDLATAKFIAAKGRILVMYLGDIVEIGPIEKILETPMHPYTRALLSAVPIPDPSFKRKNTEIPIKGMEITDLTERKSGCSFAPRCPFAQKDCLEKDIPSKQVDERQVKCLHFKELPKWDI